MARWYGSFDNSTISALEAATAGNRRQRRAFTSPSGATLKATLVAAQAALSTAFYAAIDANNRDGSLGIVVPADGYTRAAGNFSGSNLYINAGAQYNADPLVRPTAQILVAGSTAESPTDAFSVTETLYTDTVTALEAILTALTVKTARTSLSPWRMLASLHYDAAMTYLAWDDFTPGTPTGFVVGQMPSQSAASTLTLTVNWGNQYPADAEGNIVLNAQLSRNGGGSSISLTNQTVAASAGTYDWVIPGGTLSAGTYTIDIGGEFRDAIITANAGVEATFTDTDIATLT